MTRELFYKLYADAKEQPDVDMYIAEYGYPDYFDEISDDPAEVVKVLTDIHTAANMTMRDVIKACGLNQSSFARYFNIPLRTVQHWMVDRECPEYVKIMIMELAGIIKI